MKIRIEPYKTWSGGAKALGLRCGILRATTKQINKHGDFDIIINWGRNERRFNGQYINKVESVRLATDKLLAANRFAEAAVTQPDFTTEQNVAREWLNSGCHVVSRKLLRGSGGRGIVFCGPDGSELTTNYELPHAPLYTKYIKKAEEYRVHVAFGNVIDVQMKKRRLEVPDDKVNWQIRNYDNGWVFARENVVAPEAVTSSAVAAVAALGLDFGAVDIGYNKHSCTAVVFEVNTAPGLEGTTLDKYYAAFMNKFPCLKGGMYKKRREGLI